MDIYKTAGKIAGLGVPRIALVVVMSSTGLSGGAAIVTALAFLGGPLGMLGGLAILGILVFIGSAISKYGFWQFFKKVVST